VKPFVRAIFAEEFEVSREAVLKAVTSLLPRWQLVVVLYYGLDGGEPLVDERIGEDFLDIVRQAVWRHRHNAIIYLRHPTRARKLVAAKIG
jgi:DNA-directed RNA polymerase sigma subunit (sigma70/sigma32)